MLNKIKESTIAVGGIGGSGTRVVAQILKELGYFIGNDLNEPNDNLLFTLLFKRENILIQTDKELEKLFAIFMTVLKQDRDLSQKELNILDKLSSKDREQHKKEWLEDRLKLLKHDSKLVKYAWKEPNTHIVIERLLKLDENLKFIYVYRNGLDMAYSSNQNQLKLWGSIFFAEKDIAINPKNSLKYWCMAHKRILKLQEEFSNKIYMLDFDRLCTDTTYSLEKLQDFIGFQDNIESFKNMLQKPTSLDRYKLHDLSEFDVEDLEFISTLYNI